MELTAADVRLTDIGDVTFTFSWTGDATEPATVLWSSTLFPAGQGAPVQLGYKLVGGEFSTFFVFHLATGNTHQVNLPGAAVLTDDELVATFPASAIGDLGSGWRWTATLNVDGADVDQREGTTA